MATPTSGTQAAQQNGTAKTGGRKRHVASQAGVTRYGKPIGSEIGGPRDANHAAIQQDQGARKNYGDLISGDQAAQRKSLDGMSTEDLNKLADISFSFKSSDPKVVALRIAARNAQARRGIHVKVGQTQTNPTAGKAAPSVNYNNRGNAKALANLGPASAKLIELANAAKEKNTSKLGNFPIPDVNHLRKAMQAIGRAKPEHRPLIARHIIARAGKLNATHLVGDHIKHYARGARKPGSIGMTREEADEIELAGRWKHGYIPLDAEALASKTKGRTGGKKWWGDNTKGGVSGNLKPHGSPKSGSPNRGIESNPAHRHKLMEQGRQARIRQGTATAGDHATERAAQQLKATSGKPSPPAHGGSTKLTKVVKSEVPKTAPRGAKVNDTYTRGHAGAKDGFDRGHKVSYTLNGKKHTGRITRIENGSGATVMRDRGQGAHDLIDRKNLSHAATPEKQSHAAYLAAPKGSPEKARYAAETKKHFDARAKQDIANGQQRLQKLGIDAHGNKLTPAADTPKAAPKMAAPVHQTEGNKLISEQNQLQRKVSAGTATDADRARLAAIKSRLGETPAVLAERYVQMHGTGGARTKLEQLEKKAKPTARDKAMITALRSAVAGGGQGKA